MAEHETKVDLGRRIVETRMSGIFDEASMGEWADAYRAATDRMRGQKHMVIADMRGMGTLRAPVAALLGEAIGYARGRGVVLCAHISDDTVQRLQAARVARQASAQDDVTVDVASYDEAVKVCDEGLERIDDATPIASIRE